METDHVDRDAKAPVNVASRSSMIEAN